MSHVARLIRVMIVDDEEPARNELKYLLEQFADVMVIAIVDNCLNIAELVSKLKPHLLFMDIDMPVVSGLQAAAQIKDTDVSPLLVFATAHEEFALKAFDLNAVDYLLKPFSTKRVTFCLEKVRGMLSNALPAERKQLQTDLNNMNQLPAQNKLLIEERGKLTVINASDIIAAACTAGQLAIYTVQKCYQSSMSLQEMQSRLPEKNFFRSHRAYLVNIEKIREIIPWFNGTYNLLLEGMETEVPVSRQHAAKLKKMFGF